MRDETKRRGRALLRPLVVFLARLHISPTAVTLAALPLAFGAAWAFAAGRFVVAGILVAMNGLCDSIDGELSRLTGTASDSGAFIDSNVDRLSEAVVLAGVYWYYQPRHPLYGLLAVSAMVFSLLVSYVRARAEGLGRDCRVGLFERPVRVVVLLVGALLLGSAWMPVALAVIAAGSLVTVIHRFVHVLRQPAGGR